MSFASTSVENVGERNGEMKEMGRFCNSVDFFKYLVSTLFTVLSPGVLELMGCSMDSCKTDSDSLFSRLTKQVNLKRYWDGVSFEAHPWLFLLRHVCNK